MHSFRRLRAALHRPGWPLLAVALCAGLASVLLTVWAASPSGNALESHVGARLRGTAGREVPLSAVAPILRQAVVVTEDERFYHHHGIDLIGVLRAVPYDLTHFSLAQGASTITEQVAKLDYLGGNDHSPWRKLEDATVALKLEQHYSKEEILAAYLNSAYFGDGAYGVSQASEQYFGLSPARLDLARASLLAGLIQAPTAYDPLVHPQAARERQAEVLRSLVRDGIATSAEARAALRQPLALEGGGILAGLANASLAVGPAFVWWELGVGAFLALIGAALLVAVRRFAGPQLMLRVAGALAAVALLLAGAAAAASSFRAA